MFQQEDYVPGRASTTAPVPLRMDDEELSRYKGPCMHPSEKLDSGPNIYQVKADLMNSIWERGGITAATVAVGMGPKHVALEVASRVRDFEAMVGEYDFTLASDGSALALKQSSEYHAIQRLALALPPRVACAIWNSHAARKSRDPGIRLWTVDGS